MSIETAGARLKKIRQERGFALEDVQKKTKIHINILRAIEGDSISDLSPIYLKGFIKIYCACLGVDPKDYITAGVPADKPVLNATVGKPIGERVEKSASLRKEAPVKLNPVNSPAFDFKKILKVVLIFGAVLICVMLFFKLVKFISSRPKRRPAILRKAAIPAAAQPKKTQAAKNIKAVSAPVPVKTKEPILEGFTFGIFARDKSWISAKVDGKTIFHGVLAKGRSQTWQAKEKVELSLGDAGAVELQVNDQRFSNLGRRGRPLKNILINKEGLKIAR